MLLWGSNVAAVLGGGELASGRAFAQHVDAEEGQSRVDAIQSTTQRDNGEGVPYQVQYAFHRDKQKVWVENTSRWFAGADGKPLRAIGTVRLIDARHEREQALIRLARFDPLTAEMNRLHSHRVARR